MADNCFISPISQRKKRKLLKASIPFIDDFEIDEKSGIMLAAEDTRRALDCWAVEIESESQTSVPGLVQLSLRMRTATDADRTPTGVPVVARTGVEIRLLEGKGCEHWRDAFQSLKKLLERKHPQLNIILVFNERVDMDELDPEAIHVFVHSDIKRGGLTEIEGFEGRIRCLPGRKVITASYDVHTQSDLAVKVSQAFETCLPFVDGPVDACVKLIKKYNGADLITLASWDGEGRQKFVDVVKTFARQIDRKVVVEVPHGKVREFSEDENFHLLIWSSPNTRRDERLVVPATVMWDTRVDCRDKSFRPSLIQGSRIIYDPRGYAVAELVQKSHLYVYHDLVHHGSENEIKILRHILEAARDMLTADVDDQSLLIDQTGWKMQTPPCLFLEAASKLLPMVGKNILIHDGGLPEHHLSGDYFHIWASPRSSEAPGVALHHGNLLNYPTEYLESFQGTGSGLELIDPVTGTVLGEVEGNSLQLLIRFTEFSSAHESYQRHIIEWVFDEAIKLLALPEGEREQFVQEQRQKHLAEAAKTYAKFCAQRHLTEAAQAQEKLQSLEAQVSDLQEKIVKKIREAADAKRRYESAQSTANMQDEYLREFEQLLSVEGVEHVWIKESNVLCIRTKHIYLTPSGQTKTFDIGKFRMEVYLDGSRGGISFFNITKQGKGGTKGYNIHHPHVNKAGAPCLGNISEMIGQLIARYQFSVVAQIGLQFLESVNTKDVAGSEIFICWPEVPTNPI